MSDPAPTPAQYPWESSYPPEIDWHADIPVAPLYRLMDDAVARFGDRPLETEVLHGAAVPGERCAGPAVWQLPESTVVVPPGWVGHVDDHGTLVLEAA